MKKTSIENSSLDWRNPRMLELCRARGKMVGRLLSSAPQQEGISHRRGSWMTNMIVGALLEAWHRRRWGVGMGPQPQIELSPEDVLPPHDLPQFHSYSESDAA